MENENLIMRITNRYSRMTRSEKKVADFVLANSQETLHATINDLAQLCDVGETSVFRFCRTLSLSGYQDFKLSLALSTSMPEIAQPKDTINILDSPNCAVTAQKVMQTYTLSLNKAINSFNFRAIDKTVDLLLSSKTINFFGLGGSGTSAMEAMNKFIKILPYVTYNMDSHMQITQAALLKKEDLAIIFCNSGITKDCIKMAEICHKNQASVIFITMFLKTPAAQYSDIVLLCGANEGPLEGGSIAAKTTQLFLIDILYAEAYKRLGEIALENKARTSRVITEKMM